MDKDPLSDYFFSLLKIFSKAMILPQVLMLSLGSHACLNERSVCLQSHHGLFFLFISNSNREFSGCTAFRYYGLASFF